MDEKAYSITKLWILHQYQITLTVVAEEVTMPSFEMRVY
jgi:hypothetical protein